MFERPIQLEYSAFSKDPQGNLWIDLPRKEQSIFDTQPQNARAVISPLGIERSETIDRMSLFSDLIQRSKVSSRKMRGVPVGVEATINKVSEEVYTHQSWFHKNIVSLFRDHSSTTLAVEKVFNPTAPLATDVFHLFDYLRPTITDQGFNLIQPYGAIGKKLYMPFVPGQTLLQTLKNYIYTPIGEETMDTFFKVFDQYVVMPLHATIENTLEEYLFQHGFRQDTYFLWGYHKGDKRIYAAADLSDQVQPKAYNNMIVDPAIDKELYSLLLAKDYARACEMLKPALTIIDPVVIETKNTQ